MRYLWKWTGILVALLLIPAGITLLFNGAGNRKDARLGVQVITEEGTHISAEEYIMGMAATQADYIQEREAWKAWMIVCRTNFVKAVDGRKKVREDELGLDYISKEELEKKNGKKAYITMLDTLERAQQDTSGKILSYEGSPAHAIYHEISPGQTVSSKEIFGKKVDYLTTVDSSQDVESKDYITMKVIRYEDCAGKLKDEKHQITKEDCKNVKVTEKTEHGYVKTVSAGEVSWSGKEWSEKFDLPSQFFYMEEYEGKLRIVCLGKGNGVGMSLYGVNVLAARKIPVKMLLSYYYPGTEIK